MRQMRHFPFFAPIHHYFLPLIPLCFCITPSPFSSAGHTFCHPPQEDQPAAAAAAAAAAVVASRAEQFIFYLPFFLVQ